MAAEMVFLDVETTVPHRAGQRFWMLEFGAILVCPRKLVEVGSYCTLIRPGDLSAVPETSGRDAGITRRAVAAAPAFEEVADRIYDFLNGRVWAGHNIRRFDCARIREAFADAGRPAPEPIGIIDSLSVLTHQFGRRAGNLKMATLASYFGLGQQKHRSLDDVRMNLEVLKHCATVLLLESSLPQVLLSGNNNNNNNNNSLHGHSSILTRSKAMNARSCAEEEEAAAAGRKSPPTYLPSHRPVPYGKKDKLGKVMIKGAAGALCAAARGRQSLGANLLKHSRCLLR